MAGSSQSRLTLVDNFPANVLVLEYGWLNSDRPLQRQVVNGENASSVVEQLGVRNDSVVGKNLVPFLKSYLKLMPRQMRPEASVRSSCKRNMTVDPTIEVGREWILELSAIVICHPNERLNSVALVHLNALKNDIAGRFARFFCRDGPESEEFLDHSGDHLRILDDAPSGIRVIGQISEGPTNVRRQGVQPPEKYR